MSLALVPLQTNMSSINPPIAVEPDNSKRGQAEVANSVITSTFNLPSDEQKTRVYHKHLDKWSNNQLTPCIHRVSRYVHESDVAWQVSLAAGGSILLGAATGAGIGCGVGCIIAGPPGMIGGAVIGGAAGAGLAFVTSTTVAIVKTRNDYIHWKRYNRYNEMMPALIKLQENHKIFESFTCPITHELFSDPVITPTGITYERSALLDYLKLKGGTAEDPCWGTAEDPCCSMTITKDNLYDDYSMIGYILIGLETLIKKDLEKLSFNSDDQMALTSLLRDINIQIKQSEVLGRKLITDLHVKRIVNAKTCKIYNLKLNELLRD